jgi:antirestriction protein ArdC
MRPHSTSSIYSEVTNRIIAALEAGAVPWTRPWRSVAHHNAISRAPYRGINALVLNLTALERGYESAAWITYRQAQSLGGHVRRGERGTAIVWWRAPAGPPADPDVEADAHQHRYWLLRTYTVFNAGQVEGLTLQVDPEQHESPRSGAFDAAVALYGADIRHGGDRAFYDPVADRIQMPPRAWFDPPDRYYGVLGHELIHHSGAPQRLARDLSGRFGSAAYAADELVSEIGSAFLAARFRVPQATDANASYIASWIRLLGSDSRAIFTAARLAQQAADFIAAPRTGAEEAEGEAVALSAGGDVCGSRNAVLVRTD